MNVVLFLIAMIVSFGFGVKIGTDSATEKVARVMEIVTAMFIENISQVKAIEKKVLYGIFETTCDEFEVKYKLPPQN